MLHASTDFSYHFKTTITREIRSNIYEETMLGIYTNVIMHALHKIIALFRVIRESHAVILQDRVVPASQVPFPGEPSGELGNGT